MENSGVIKTVSQFSKALPRESIELLLDLAEGCRKVKNYVYGRYSGIKSIEKLALRFEIANEMRYISLKKELNLPSAYYELAIYDAIKDIKSMWENLKNKIRDLIRLNQNLTEQERKYIRAVLKIDYMFAAALQRKKFEKPKIFEDDNLNYRRLNNLICRLTRKYKKNLSVKSSSIIYLKPEAYKYAGGGIFVATKVKRKRLFIPLRDKRIFSSQMLMIVKDNYVELKIPVEVKIKLHDDYVNTIFASIGYRDMITLSNGNIYGKELNKYVSSETDRLAAANKNRRKAAAAYYESISKGNSKKALKIKKNNMGKKKYGLKKKSNAEKTRTFINSEINRMFREEKPEKIVIANKIKPNLNVFSKKTREKLTRSFDGYIRSRLKFKCAANGIEVAAVNPKNISALCCECGGEGKKQGNMFKCGVCGQEIPIALNSARNIEKRAETGFK